MPSDEFSALRPSEMSAGFKTGRDLSKPAAIDNKPGNSTSQSLLRRASSSETDHLNGEIALLGRLHIVPTPANVAVQRAMRGQMARGGGPGEVSSTVVLRDALRVDLGGARACM